MMFDTHAMYSEFLRLNLQQKRAKIKAIVYLLASKNPVYKVMQDVLQHFHDNVSESLLDYIYKLTMQIISDYVRKNILHDQIHDLDLLKKTI